jgi:predicted phosphodiesterase
MKKSKESYKLLVIGDLHISDKRVKAISTAMSSIYSVVDKSYKDTKFTHIVLLGDIFNKYPTITERISFVSSLNSLSRYSNSIVCIKGTESHECSKNKLNYQDILDIAKGSLKITSHKRFIFDNYMFVHESIKGAKFDNGIVEKEGLDLSTIKETVIAGHYHTPYDNFVGSIYKTTFSQKDDTKRIGIISNGKIKYTSIDSRPMYEIDLIGKLGKVVCPQLKELKAIPKDTELDLKIKATTDIKTLPSIHSNIKKIQSKFNVEYFQEDIEINRKKVDVPKNLNDLQLLEVYCKNTKTDFNLVKGEL